MAAATVVATSISFRDALLVVKGESDVASREDANTVIAESVKTSVFHVATYWQSRKTFRRWHEFDDLCQDLRVVLLTRCIQGFVIPEGVSDDTIARIFGRFAIVSLHNCMRDMRRHAGRNWTMHMASLDSYASGRQGRREMDASELAEDRSYPNEHMALEEREMFGAIRAALSEKQAKIAYLLYEGRSWKQVGAILGEKPGTLRDQMRKRAAPALKAMLARWAS